MSSSHPRVSVIIPNWNGAHHLPECLESLARQRFVDFHTVVVDNGSSDDSFEVIRDSTLPVEVIRKEANLGFSAAVNAGIRATESELIVLLNNDTRVDPGWLEALVVAMDEHPEMSFGASRMLLYDPPHRIDSAGDRFSLWAGGGANIGAGDAPDKHDQPARVFGACAGAAIYRRRLFEDIGLFDEDFFLIFEDVDIDLRAQVAGHDCLYIPAAIVYHKRGASTDLACAETTARAWRNMIWVAGRSLPGLLFVLWLTLFTARVGVQTSWRLLRLPFHRGAGAAARDQDHAQTRSANDPARSLADHPRISRRQRARLYVRALRAGFARLPEKRRANRPLRRRGSLALLPVLLRPVRPLQRGQERVSGTSVP